MEGYLQYTSNQFGFKRKHGTEMCVFVLKELIRYYIKHGSCIYVALLDASKAFDRVNHTKLFSKLLRLGVPTWIIKVLFAPSAKGLQQTVNMCYAYGCDNDIIFNSSQSQVMFLIR